MKFEELTVGRTIHYVLPQGGAEPSVRDEKMDRIRSRFGRCLAAQVIGRDEGRTVEDTPIVVVRVLVPGAAPTRYSHPAGGPDDFDELIRPDSTNWHDPRSCKPQP